YPGHQPYPGQSDSDQYPYSARPESGPQGRDQWLESTPMADWVRPAQASQPTRRGRAAGVGRPEAPAQAPPPVRRSSKRRTFMIVAIAAVLVAGAIAAGGSYLLLRTKGSPQQTATEYLSAWQRGDYRAMNKITVSRPSGGLAGPLTAADTQLGVRSTALKL